MASVTIDLPRPSIADISGDYRISWNDVTTPNALGVIPADLMAGNVQGVLTRVQVNGFTDAIQLRIENLDTTASTYGRSSGQNLSQAVTDNLYALTFRTDGVEDLVVAGPTRSSVDAFSDETEEYVWDVDSTLASYGDESNPVRFWANDVNELYEDILTSVSRLIISDEVPATRLTDDDNTLQIAAGNPSLSATLRQLPKEPYPPLTLKEDTPNPVIDIATLLPQYYRSENVWRDLSAVIQSEIVDEVIDSVTRIRRLRDLDRVDDDLVPRMLKLLGFYLDISDLSDNEVLRKVAKSIPYHHERSATDTFISILEIFTQVKIKVKELYTSRRPAPFTFTTTSEIRSFSITLPEVPVVPFSVSLHIATVSDPILAVDDGEGNLGLSSLAIDSGSVNYVTGEVVITLAVTSDIGDIITISYNTDKYQEFVAEVPDDESVFNGFSGDYYLTNHVNLEITGRLGISLDDLTRLFYYIAPAVLVLNAIESPIDFDPAPMHLGAGVTFSILI